MLFVACEFHIGDKKKVQEDLWKKNDWLTWCGKKEKTQAEFVWITFFLPKRPHEGVQSTSEQPSAVYKRHWCRWQPNASGWFSLPFPLQCCVRVIGATPSAKTHDVASLISTESCQPQLLKSGCFFLNLSKKEKKVGSLPLFREGETCTAAGSRSRCSPLTHVIPSNRVYQTRGRLKR